MSPAPVSVAPYVHCARCVDESAPWLVGRSNDGACWWVTNGEWEPGHPDLVKARCSTMAEAVELATGHNRTLSRNGRPPLPFSIALVRDAMERADYNITAAARALGVHRSSLHRWFVDRFGEPESVAKPRGFATGGRVR